MEIFLTIIAFLVIFSLIVLIHEWGHFYAAKRAGVKVLEFGLGIPPKIWGFKPKKSETEYTINAIPFGGFVRLYGEDFTDKRAARSKRSFANVASYWKVLIVLAGVIMNFFLAWLLITFGFIVGMQPLLVTQQDVYDAIDQGLIELEEGIYVQSVNDPSTSLQEGERIIEINGKSIGFGNDLNSLEDGEEVQLKVRNSKEDYYTSFTWDKENSPIDFEDLAYIPRVIIYHVDSGSEYGKYFLEGDAVVEIDGTTVFSSEQFSDLLDSDSDQKYQVFRSRGAFDAIKNSEINYGFVISDVIANSPADQSGLLAGDLIKSVNDIEITDLEKLENALSLQIKELSYTVLRNGNEIRFFISPDENGMAGVYISELKEKDGLFYFEKTVPVSILDIKNVSYPFYYAPIKSIEEVARLSVLTLQMFGSVLTSFVTSFSVPEGVAGPVGIAQMTHSFLQEGLVSLIRFTAILSLSLGIINVLPIPGLDGGRFVLIMYSVISRKKLNAKVEALIHLFGFMFLILLLIVVTFNDLVRLFT